MLHRLSITLRNTKKQHLPRRKPRPLKNTKPPKKPLQNQLQPRRKRRLLKKRTKNRLSTKLQNRLLSQQHNIAALSTGLYSKSALIQRRFFRRAIMLRRYRFELILLLLIICALVATRFFLY